MRRYSSIPITLCSPDKDLPISWTLSPFTRFIYVLSHEFHFSAGHKHENIAAKHKRRSRGISLFQKHCIELSGFENAHLLRSKRTACLVGNRLSFWRTSHTWGMFFYPSRLLFFAQDIAWQLQGNVFIDALLTFHGTVFASIICLPLSKTLSPFATYTAEHHKFHCCAGWTWQFIRKVLGCDPLSFYPPVLPNMGLPVSKNSLAIPGIFIPEKGTLFTLFNTPERLG